MFEILQNTLFRARRAASSRVDRPAAERRDAAQEVPMATSVSRVEGAVLARLAPTSRGIAPRLSERFADANAHEGRLVPVRLRPSGVLWRIHPAPAGDLAPAGAALASSQPGAPR